MGAVLVSICILLDVLGAVGDRFENNIRIVLDHL